MKSLSRCLWKSVAALFVLALLTSLCACGAKEKESEPTVAVQVTPAQRNSISQIVAADAVIFPVKQATVSAKITSTITDFKVQRGSRVRKGQLLAILENRDLAAQAEASQGDFEQANANYQIAVNAGLPQQVQKAELDAASSKAAFVAAEKVEASRKELFQQGAIPRRDLDAAGVALAQARSQNEQAQKQLADLQRIGKEQLMKAAQGTKEAAEGHYRAAAAQLSYSEIRSPIDGVVADRPAYVGDLAVANQPILTVVDTSTLVAKMHIPQSEALQLRVGDRAQIKLPDGQRSAEGRVSLISPTLDPGSTTIELWIELRKPDPALKPGMTVSAEMTAKTVTDTVVVPTGAIFKNTEGAYYVLLGGSDHKAHQKVVQVGVRNNNFTQIASGVNAGDPVITSGGYGIADGTTITVEQPSTPGSAEKKTGPAAAPKDQE
jgi:multidrug efflux pump subunit AcrA (membrane-fusion protein)